VRNSGSRAGAEVVEVFAAQRAASVTPPVKRLRRFIKVPLEPGASMPLQFTLTKSDLSYIGLAGKPVTDPGIFTVMVGNLRQDVTIR
jgi:beta-glucosidase